MIELADIAAVALRHAAPLGTGNVIPRFWVSTADQPSEFRPVLYSPMICFILQGAKRTVVGDRVLNYGAGESLIVGAELAAMWQITEADANCPFVSVNLQIDPAVVSSILFDASDVMRGPIAAGFNVSAADPHQLEVWRRLLDLLDRPEEVAFLAPHLEQELVFRLLKGQHGILLRQLVGVDSRLSRIRRAMKWVRENYSAPLRVAEIADIAGMSTSAFHRHFKVVTALSPLQYQKQIRLQEARRQLLAAPNDTAGVAFAVGYESASQFTREYKRLFGQSPRQDIRRLRSAVVVESLAG